MSDFNPIKELRKFLEAEELAFESQAKHKKLPGQLKLLEGTFKRIEIFMPEVVQRMLTEAGQEK